MIGAWAQWKEAFGVVPHAVIGAVAANQFMPPRQTGDVDFAVASRDVDAATASLRAAGWQRLNPLVLRPPLTGFAWLTDDGGAVEVLTVPDRWGEQLVAGATANIEEGLSMAPLPHLVTLKMIAGRTIDGGDISRMLGHQDELTLQAVRVTARKVLGPEEMADLDQLIELGKLEYGSRPPFADRVEGTEVGGLFELD
jgi:hypothetical protein